MHRLTTTHSIHISMKLRRVAAVLMSTAFLITLQAVSTPAFAVGLAPVSEEEREQRFQDLSDRLELTEEQKPEVKSILIKDRESRLTLLRENGVDIEAGEKPSMFTMMGMRSDMTSLNERTRSDLSAILSPDQLDIYDPLADERRAQMRASMGF